MPLWPWRISEGPHCRARLLPLLAGSQAVLVRSHVSVGVWSAGLGIIDCGRRWGWEWARQDLEPVESVPCCLMAPPRPGPWNVLA